MIAEYQLGYRLQITDLRLIRIISSILSDEMIDQNTLCRADLSLSDEIAIWAWAKAQSSWTELAWLVDVLVSCVADFADANICNWWPLNSFKKLIIPGSHIPCRPIAQGLRNISSIVCFSY